MWFVNSYFLKAINGMFESPRADALKVNSYLFTELPLEQRGSHTPISAVEQVTMWSLLETSRLQALKNVCMR